MHLSATDPSVGSVADRCKIHATNRLRHRLSDWAGLTNGSWTTFGLIPGSPSIDKALKIEPWARRDVLSTLCPLNVRSCVAGACTYLQQIPNENERRAGFPQRSGSRLRSLVFGLYPYCQYVL